MTKRCLTVTTLVLLLLLSCGAPPAAQTPTPTTELQAYVEQQDRIQQVEQWLIPVSPGGGLDFEDPRSLTERMEHYGVPGVSIAVIEDYWLVWAKGYGLLEAGGDTPVTPDSLFHAGSIARPVSAAAALVLVEQGLLDLDQDVNDKLASWHVPENTYTMQEKITLRWLLSHIRSRSTKRFPATLIDKPDKCCTICTWPSESFN